MKPLPRRSLSCVAQLCVLAGWALTGCGGSTSTRTPSPRTATGTPSPRTATGTPSPGATKTFSAPGMAIHFRFPARFTSRTAHSHRVAGNTSRASQAAVGIGRFDLLIVSRFPRRPVAVTVANVARLKPQFDAAVSSAVGHHVSSAIATVGGRPALVYAPTRIAGLPVPVTSRIVDVFVADDEYELNCQYTPAHAGAMTAACRQMLTTLRVTR